MRYCCRFFSTVVTSVILVLLLATSAQAQQSLPSLSPMQNIGEELLTVQELAEEATLSAEASISAQQATDSANLIERVVEKKPDITEPEGEVKSQLERYLEETPIGPLTLTNVVQHAIRNAVSRGVPANTIVLVLLFPVVAALIAASRHLVGLRGFGIFTPAVLSVAFVATDVVSGIGLFLVILLMADVGRRVLRKMKLQYLPRMALILWFVCLGVLAALLVAPYLNLEALATISIFPILILVLLSENFIEVQMGKSRREATELALETIVLALISSLVLSLNSLQRFAILHPEILIIIIAVFDIFMGKYSGLRLTEYLKFRKVRLQQ